MPNEIQIQSPVSLSCLPLTGGKVSGFYQMGGESFLPPVGDDYKAVPQRLDRFKIVVTVGAVACPDLPVAYSEQPTGWEVNAPNLTAADEVTLTAKLIDTLATGGPAVLDDHSVSPVRVDVLCITKPVIDGDTGLAGGDTSTAPVGVGKIPAPRPRFRHMTVRTFYPIAPGATDQIHRVVAIVTRVDKTTPPARREVWASAEAILQAGVASAIIPIPPAATARVSYEYHFVQMINTTNAMHFRTPAVKLP